MELRRTVAKNVKMLRLERGHTQEGLSALAGLDRNYIGMIERRERSPTVDTLEKLAKALKVEPIAFLATSLDESRASSPADDGAP
jgi:transcriptional regulator with XRE-family HTH domain